jgi:ribosomal protein L16 Arg81 hydroxylase
MIELGLTTEDFHERYRERQPYLRKQALRGAPFGWRELDAALHRVEPTAPIVQLFNGAPIAEERFTDVAMQLGAPRRRWSKRRLYAELAGGATLVVNGLENHSLEAQRLCNEIGRLSGAPTAGNAYLSTGGRGTFGRHWDTHDVFAIQLIGRKRWQVFEPTWPLPLGMHRSDDSGHACPAEPILDVSLEAGDLLYVPRGWWHHVLPTDGPSLHLSVGTYPPTVHDYVSWACARHLPGALAARRSLDSAVGAAEIDAAVAALSAALTSPATRAEFEREAARRNGPRGELNTELHLARGADGLAPSDAIVLNQGVAFDRGAAEILVPGGRLRLRPLACAVLAALGGVALSLEALRARLAGEDPDEIRVAVLELSEHEVVTIARSAR